MKIHLFYQKPSKDTRKTRFLPFFSFQRHRKNVIVINNSCVYFISECVYPSVCVFTEVKVQAGRKDTQIITVSESLFAPYFEICVEKACVST